MMRVRVKQLPADLQHANLCRLHPRTMDLLAVKPGELLLLEVAGRDEPPLPANSTGSGQDPPEKPRFQENRSLVRVWLRCPGVGLTPGGREYAEIEIDPGLLEYLDIKENSVVVLRSDFKEETLSSITFETASRISNEERAELQRLIQHANWAVYPEGFFAVNLSGKPIDLMVATPCIPPVVIGPGTVVSIHDETESGELQLHNRILATEMTLQQTQKRKALLRLETKKMNQEAQRIAHEEEGCDETSEISSKEIEELRERVGGLRLREHELTKTHNELESEYQRLSDDLDKLQSEQIGELDRGTEAEYEILKKTIQADIAEFERQVQSVQA